MTASSASELLPVPASPMISWRWPRPIGIMVSTILLPLSSGRSTKSRAMIGGDATSRARRRCGRGCRPAVERAAQRIDHAAEKVVADADVEPPAGQVRRGAGDEAILLAEQDGADAPAAEMEHQRLAAVVETQDLVHGRRGQPLDPGDAVADRHHPAHLADAQLRAVRLGRRAALAPAQRVARAQPPRLPLSAKTPSSPATLKSSCQAPSDRRTPASRPLSSTKSNSPRTPSRASTAPASRARSGSGSG